MGDIQNSFIVKTTPEKLYDYLADPKTIPEQLEGSIEVDVKSEGLVLEQGNQCQLTMTRLGMTQPVKISVDESIRGKKLSYRQVEGLFRSWRHVIQIEGHDQQSCLCKDSIYYSLPFGVLGHVLDDLIVRSDLGKILRSRSQKIREAFD